MRWIVFFSLFALVLAGSTLPAKADAACVEECGLTYWACSDNCGAFGGALCEQNCTDAYNACVNQCSQCPTYRDYSTLQYINKTDTNSTTCVKNTAINDATGYIYKIFTTHFLRYNWRETTQCNGTKSTQLLSTAPVDGTCYFKKAGSNNLCSPFSTTALTACP